jgi:hypothetical protein
VPGRVSRIELRPLRPLDRSTGACACVVSHGGGGAKNCMNNASGTRKERPIARQTRGATSSSGSVWCSIAARLSSWNSGSLSDRRHGGAASGTQGMVRSKNALRPAPMAHTRGRQRAARVPALELYAQLGEPLVVDTHGATGDLPHIDQAPLHVHAHHARRAKPHLHRAGAALVRHGRPQIERKQARKAERAALAVNYLGAVQRCSNGAAALGA